MSSEFNLGAIPMNGDCTRTASRSIENKRLGIAFCSMRMVHVYYVFLSSRHRMSKSTLDSTCKTDRPQIKKQKKKTPDSDCSEIFQNCPDALYFFFSYRGACQWKPWLQVSRVFGDPILRTDYWVVLNQIMPAGSASQATTYGDCFGFGWHFSNCVLHQ